MLTLVEPCITRTILDRPHLGCAMLIAACEESEIKTTLIKGQTRYLKNMFLNDSKELWDFIHSLKDNDSKKLRITEYKKYLQENGLPQFRNELKSLYHYVITDKNPRHYFNTQMVGKFINLYQFFLSVYSYHLEELNYSNIKIIDHYISEIIKSNPSYVSFSLHGDFDPFTRTIRKRIKELTGVPIIVGGSLTPFVDLKKLDETFEKEYFDYLVVGVGEQALPSLIKALEKGKEPKGIANVFYKKDGKVKGNDLGVIDDLDALPYPDYSQFDLDLYLAPKRILPLQTARGCSWRKCAFCSHHKIYLGEYKTFSIKKVIETIKHLQNTYSCSHFALHDEELPAGRAKKISEEILNNNLNDISIFAYARLTNGYNSNELLGHLRKAGFASFNWGMESGSQRVLDLMNKGTKVSAMSQVLKKSSKNGITNLCFLIFGFPGETKKETQETLEFLKKHADYIADLMPGTFILNLNSPIGKNPEKWGVHIKEDGSYLTKGGMTCEEVNTFFSRLNKELLINKVKLTSDKLKNVLPGYNRRCLYFLNSSHELLSNTTLLERLKNGRLDIFPLILGETKKKGNKTIFQPVKINETCYINKYCPEKEKVLDRFEEKIFVLSDGTSSMEDIILTIYNDFRGRYNKKYIHKKCADFFRDIFSKNWGLGYAKSW